MQLSGDFLKGELLAYPGRRLKGVNDRACRSCRWKFSHSVTDVRNSMQESVAAMWLVAAVWNITFLQCLLRRRVGQAIFGRVLRVSKGMDGES